jgi:predicted alternative tryptophan synthase beta-subunit
MQLMFRLFMKKKYRAQVIGSFQNLNNYCKTLLASKKEHPYSIVLPIGITAENTYS